MSQGGFDDLMAPQGIEGYEKAREPYFSNLSSGTTALGLGSWVGAQLGGLGFMV